MCGIAGFFGDLSHEAAKRSLSQMLASIASRGPDGEGVHVAQGGGGPCVALGSRRLAIVDLTAKGQQPMIDAASGIALAYNGETYNAPELRVQLQAEGVQFEGSSDTEVALRAYVRWGVGAFERLSGIFAIALWDPRRGRLILARDPFGVKPLYVAQRPHGLIFASEVKALLAGGLVEPRLDRAGLATFLAFGAAQEPLTLVEGVRALKPGTWAAYERGQLVEERAFWLPPPRLRRVPSREVLVERCRSTLASATARQLRADVPVAVFLSSGIDSGLIAAYAKRASSAPPLALTLAFEGVTSGDEREGAARAAARLGLPHTVETIHASEVKALALSWLSAMDQPSADGINHFLIARAARASGIRVALAGSGADEMFGGYDSFRRVIRWRRVLAMTAWVPRAARVGAARQGGRWLRRTVALKALDIAGGPRGLRSLTLQFRRLFSDSELAAFGIVPASLGLSRDWEPPEAAVERLEVEGDPVATIQTVESRRYLVNTILRETDVYGMAQGVEIRVPFLDAEVAGFALSLPGRALCPDPGALKPLLRGAAEGVLPPESLATPKLGFSVPLGEWLAGPLRPVAEREFAFLKERRVLPPDAIDATWALFERERSPRAWSRVWALVALGAWLRAHGISEDGLEKN